MPAWAAEGIKWADNNSILQPLNYRHAARSTHPKTFIDRHAVLRFGDGRDLPSLRHVVCTVAAGTVSLVCGRLPRRRCSARHLELLLGSPPVVDSSTADSHGGTSYH